jgi:uncharacterized protein YneF (UPF0154 family)
MGYVIIALVFAVAGFIVGYFVRRKNPNDPKLR